MLTGNWLAREDGFDKHPTGRRGQHRARGVSTQAVLIPETALHTTELLGELERLLGKPVLTATQVTIWRALDQLDRRPTRSGLGTLFLG